MCAVKKLIVIKRFMLAHIYDNYVLSKIKAQALHVFATDDGMRDKLKNNNKMQAFAATLMS